MSIVEPHGPDPSAAAGSPEAPDAGSPRRVVIVDDHELLRTGTRRILEEASDFVVVGEAEDGDAARRVVDETLPDVVLIDIRLPTTNGIDLARRIVSEHPAATVLILSAYDDEHYVRAALAAGVAGYLLKTTPSEQLILSIRAACDGFSVLDPGRSRSGEKGPDVGAGPRSPRLTGREQEVVRLVAQGLSNKAIARRLGISPRTVEGHLNHVFDKLATTSRTELVHYALANNLFIRDLPGGTGPPP
ncbi:MAG: response regulator [Acidimicrobiales bacterium]